MTRTRKLNLPRAPLPRQKGGPHGGAKPRELSPREEVTLRLNEMDQEGALDIEELRDALVETEMDEQDIYLEWLNSMEEYYL
jgi:hypothetical protein